jgi:hypothetical protein
MIKLSEGAKVEDYSKYLPINELKELKDKKEITILNNDKKRWKPYDDVLLQVRIQNISSIQVKVHKLDL